MKVRRTLVSLTALATLGSLAACAAPESDNGSEGDSDAASATSAEDFGGMDALVKAAQEEGELNVIALPPDWANYGEIISTFEDKYDIKVNSDQPDAASQDEINAANELKGTDQRARRLRPRPVRRPGQHRHVRAVQGRDLGRHPRRVQGRRRRLGQRLRRLHVDRLRLRRRCPTSTAVADLLKPDYKGKVALNGDPTQAGAAFSGVMMAAIANGGSADDIAPGRRLLRRPEEGRQLPAGRPRLRRPSSPGRRRSSSTGTTSAPPRPPTCDTWKTVVPRRGRGRAATTSRRSTPTRRTRRPPGSGRSSSTATRARTSGSRVAPVRCAATRWPRPAPSTTTLWEALPEVTGDPVIPTDEQTETAASTWPRTGRRPSADARPIAPAATAATPAGGSHRRRGAARLLGVLPFLAFVAIFLVVPTADGGHRRVPGRRGRPPTLANIGALGDAACHRAAWRSIVLSGVTAAHRRGARARCWRTWSSTARRRQPAPPRGHLGRAACSPSSAASCWLSP